MKIIRRMFFVGEEIMSNEKERVIKKSAVQAEL